MRSSMLPLSLVISISLLGVVKGQKWNCFRPIQPGNCTLSIEMYGYDADKKACVPFIQTGCLQNENSFPNRQECIQTCIPWRPSKCQQKLNVGSGISIIPRWYFDESTNVCKLFYYKGLGGGQNHFETITLCEETCIEGKKRYCNHDVDRGTCVFSFTRYAHNRVKNTCESFKYRGCGGNGNRFDSLSSCERTCLDKTRNPCTLPQERGLCNKVTTRYSYIPALDMCSPFPYNGCGGNSNNFINIDDCKQFCVKSVADPCSMPIVPGTCMLNYPTWGYNNRRNICEQFTYSGCQGNQNQFSTESSCLERCHKK